MNSNWKQPDSGKQISFGAEQCLYLLIRTTDWTLMSIAGILVRDKAARKRLLDAIGRPGLILSV